MDRVAIDFAYSPLGQRRGIAHRHALAKYGVSPSDKSRRYFGNDQAKFEDGLGTVLVKQRGREGCVMRSQKRRKKCEDGEAAWQEGEHISPVFIACTVYSK